MNSVSDKRSIGGMIASIGLLFQDYVSIKYMFKYLDNGLEEISFEKKDDIGIVLIDGTQVNIQVKINTFTVSMINELLPKINKSDKNIIVGSSFDDAFRNILQRKERHISNLNGQSYLDKESLKKDWEEYCDKTGVKYAESVLEYDFDVIDSLNQENIASNSIYEWADAKRIHVDAKSLLNEMLVVVAYKRARGGHLSYNEIIKIARKFRNTPIERYNDSFSPEEIIIHLETLIKDNPRFEKDLLVIKNDIENALFNEAKSRIEDCQKEKVLCEDLESIYLWLLNMLEDYSAIIERESFSENEVCYFEYAKAHFGIHDFDNARKWIDNINQKNKTTGVLLLDAQLLVIENKQKDAEEKLLSCLDIDSDCVDALGLLGDLYRENEPFKAAELYEKVLLHDDKCANAYYGLAVISENSFDLNNALKYYIRYVDALSDDPQYIVWGKLAAFSFDINVKDSFKYFQEFNRSFRKQEKIENTEGALIVVAGREETLFYELQSYKDGFEVYRNDVKVVEFKESEAVSSKIGICVSPVNYYLEKVVYQNSINPVQRTENYIREEASIPVIVRMYSNPSLYDNIMKQLRDTKKIHLNHEFSDNDKEYIVDDNGILVELELKKKDLTGLIYIGDVVLYVWIKPVGKGVEAFRKRLNIDKGFNEAAIIMTCSDGRTDILTFNKSNIIISSL